MLLFSHAGLHNYDINTMCLIKKWVFLLPVIQKWYFTFNYWTNSKKNSVWSLVAILYHRVLFEDHRAAVFQHWFHSETQVSGRLMMSGVNPLDMPRTPYQVNERKHTLGRIVTQSIILLVLLPLLLSMKRLSLLGALWVGYCGVC